MAIDYLTKASKSFAVVEYLKEVPTKAELMAVLKKLNVSAESILRKGEPDFKNNFKGQKMSELQWIEAMIKFPKLIERPIVIKGDKAVVARPTELIDQLD